MQVKANVVVVMLLAVTGISWAENLIPKAAWRRPIGLPLANAGTKKSGLEATHIDDGYYQGAPVGGIGAGTFSRTYRGDFSRWHLKGGVHKYQTVFANQFAMYQKEEGAAGSVAQVLSTNHPEGRELSSWRWNYPVGKGEYAALYPKSWYDYNWDAFPAHVTLEQFSPVLPDNYKESSYPVAVYRWHAENKTSHAVTVSVLLSWVNMLGWFRGYTTRMDDHLDQGNHNQYVEEAIRGGTMKGVLMDRNRVGAVRDEWDGQFMISTEETPGTEVSYTTTYQPDSDGSEIWKPFSADGNLNDSKRSWISSGETLAGAIAIKFVLKPGETRVVPMVITWDLPVMSAGSGRKWYRHYTDFFGTSGTHAQQIAKEGLGKATEWSDAIDAWQAPWVNDESKPVWYRGMLFNELYTLADGGSWWGRPVDSDPKTPHTFGFMECFDYPFYSTLDVLFYGSMPLIKFWPELDKQQLRQFAATVPQEDKSRYLWIWKSQQTGTEEFRQRKAKGVVPHDLGVPAEDPFEQVNQFSWQDTNGWKDLNTKFVLMIYRDYVLTGRKDQAFLQQTWPSVKEAMHYMLQYDHNGDGLPENDGYPDQTYDEWVVKGESAYSGGLYLAALRASEEIAKQIGDQAAVDDYHKLFAKAQGSYIKKLWNGQFFRYDVSSEYKDNIQADQLCGQWYASLTGLGDLVPREMQISALKKVYEFNVMHFGGGEMGAVNGITTEGKLIFRKGNPQVREVWTGTTFSLAALMLHDGMKEEAFHTAWGVYNVVYDKKGFWFRTPEAYDVDGNYRASMYMRPAAIWAMEMAEPPQK